MSGSIEDHSEAMGEEMNKRENLLTALNITLNMSDKVIYEKLFAASLIATCGLRQIQKTTTEYLRLREMLEQEQPPEES